MIGASSGIGKSVAEELLRDEYVVGVTGRREDLLKTIQEKHSGKAFFKKMDVQDLASIESICNELVTQIGGLDLLIISSGIGEENSELKFVSTPFNRQWLICEFR